MTRTELLTASSGYMLFNTGMVQAILDGRKTRAMQVMKLQPPNRIFI